MGGLPVATNHTELIAWQLCAELRALVLRYTREGPVRGDRRFRDDIRAASRSACYLTSEGFHRKRDGDFLNFLVWARGSLGELSDQIQDGHDSGYFSTAQRDEMIALVKHACGANGGLRRYLEKSLAQKAAAGRGTRRTPTNGFPKRGPRTRRPTCS